MAPGVATNALPRARIAADGPTRAARRRAAAFAVGLLVPPRGARRQRRSRTSDRARDRTGRRARTFRIGCGLLLLHPPGRVRRPGPRPGSGVALGRRWGPHAKNQRALEPTRLLRFICPPVAPKA